MSDGTIRVALVDDQQLVRAGFRMVIDSQADLQVVLEAGDGAQAVRALDPAARTATGPVDVVLMDVRMPTMDGLTATAQITARGTEAHPAPRVIVLTTFDLDEYVFEAIRAGASGFLVKDTEPVELLHAVRSVVAGDALLSPRITRRLMDEFAARAKDPGTSPSLDVLTDREREVMTLVGHGLTNDEIATRLFVSVATAKTHVSRAMIKLGARDRAQLVVFAYEAGLVRPGWSDEPG